MGSAFIAGRVDRTTQVLFTSSFLSFQVSAASAAAISAIVKNVRGGLTIGNNIFAIEGARAATAVFFSSLDVVLALRISNNEIVIAATTDAKGVHLGHTSGVLEINDVVIEANFITAAAPQAFGLFVRSPFRKTRPSVASSLRLFITLNDTFIAARTLWVPFLSTVGGNGVPAVFAVMIGGDVVQTDLQLRVRRCRLEASDSFMIAPRIAALDLQLLIKAQYGRVYASIVDTALLANATNHFGEDALIIPNVPISNAAISASSVVVGERKASFNFSVLKQPVTEEMRTPTRQAIGVAANLPIDFGPSTRVHYVAVEACKFTVVANSLPCGICVHSWSGPTGVVVARNVSFLIADGPNAASLGFVDPTKTPTSPLNSHAAASSSNDRRDALASMPRRWLMNETHMRRFLFEPRITDLATRGVAGAIQFFQSAALDSIDVRECNATVLVSTSPDFFPLYREDETEAMLSAATVPSPLPSEMPFELAPTIGWDRNGPRYLPRRPSWDTSNMKGSAAFLHAAEGRTLKLSSSVAVMDSAFRLSCGVVGNCFGVAFRGPVEMSVSAGQGLAVSRVNMSIHHDSFGADFGASNSADGEGSNHGTSGDRMHGGRWRMGGTESPTVTPAQNAERSNFGFARPVKAISSAVLFNGTSQDTISSSKSIRLDVFAAHIDMRSATSSAASTTTSSTSTTSPTDSSMYKSAEQRAANVGSGRDVYAAQSPLGEFGSFRPAVGDTTTTSSTPDSSSLSITGTIMTEGRGDQSTRLGNTSVSLHAQLVPVRRDVVGVALFDSALELFMQRTSVEIVAESGLHLHTDGNGSSPSNTATSSTSAEGSAAALVNSSVAFTVVLELCHTVTGFLVTGPAPANNLGIALNTVIVYAAAPRLNQLIRRPLCATGLSAALDVTDDGDAKAKSLWSYDGIVATTLRRQAAGVMVDYHNIRFVFAFENGVLTVAGADMPRCTGLAFSARSPLSQPNRVLQSRLLVDSTALDVRCATGAAVGVAAENSIGMTEIQLARFTTFNVYGAAAVVGALARVFAFGSLTSRVYVSVQSGNVASLVGPATFVSVDHPVAARAFIHKTESKGGSFDPDFGVTVSKTGVNVSGALAICGDENAAKAICLLGYCQSGVLAQMDFDALLQHCAAIASTSIDTANAIANAAVPNGLSANNLPKDPAPSTIVSFSLREFIAADPEASLPSDSSAAVDSHMVKRVLSFTTAVVASETSLLHYLGNLDANVKVLSDTMSLPADYVTFEESALMSRGGLNISRNVGARSFELVAHLSKRPKTTFTHRPAPLIAASIVQQFSHTVRIDRAIVRLSLGSALINTLLFATGARSTVPQRLSSTCTPMLTRTRGTTATRDSAPQTQAQQTTMSNDGKSLIVPTCLGDGSHAPDARYCHPYSVAFVTASSVMTDVDSVDSQLTSVLPISCPVVGSLLTVGTVRRPTGSDIPTVKVSSSRGVFLIGGAVRLLAIHGPTVKNRLVSLTTSAMQTVAPVHQASVLLSTESWASNLTGSAADVAAEIERMSPLSLAQVNTFTSTASAHSQESVITGMASLLKLFPAVWLRGEEGNAGPSPALPPPHINGSAPSALVIPRSLSAIILVAPPATSAAASSSSPRTPASILAAAPVTNVSLYDANFTATFANIVTPTPLRVLPNGDAENITVTILAAPTTRGDATPSDFRSTPRSTALVSTFRDQPSYALLRAQKLWGSPSTALPAGVVERNGGWVIGSTVLLRYQVKGAMPDTARRLVHVTPATNDQMPAIDSSPSPSSSSPSNSTPWLGGLKLTCVVLEDELPPFAPDLSFGTGRAAPASASVVVPCVDVCSNQRFAPFLKQCVGSNTATKTVSATPTAVVVPVTPAPVKVLTTVGTAVATGATIAVASIGAVGVAANVGRVTFLAALMECDGGLETDEELPIQSHPARIAMGSEDDPLRYHVGAVVCNIAIPAAMAASWIAVLFVWCRVTGKFIASSSDEELSVKGSGGRANRDKLNRSPPPPPTS